MRWHESFMMFHLSKSRVSLGSRPPPRLQVPVSFALPGQDIFMGPLLTSADICREGRVCMHAAMLKHKIQEKTSVMRMKWRRIMLESRRCGSTALKARQHVMLLITGLGSPLGVS